MNKKKVHFIAIGGAAMHNLALELHHNDYMVSGSDDQIFDPSKSRLQKAGIFPKKLGWHEDNITEDLDFVILGMHAKPDNIELKKAQKLGLEIFSYPEFLFQVHKNKKRVVIGGSHGKTTTTSMILHVLQDVLGKDSIDFMVGAQLSNFDRMVKISPNAEWVILEGDEYLSSPIDRRSKFLWYQPDIAVLTGIAWDHINVFPTFESYLETFRAFIRSIKKGGVLIYDKKDETLTKIVKETAKDIICIPYELPNYDIVDGKTIIKQNEDLVPVHFFGKHNLSNYLAAHEVLKNMNLSEKQIHLSIQNFMGADKRLMKIYEDKSTFVFRDFAHSPSKVMACVKAVNEQFENFDIKIFLELHTYSSLTKQFIPHYKNSLLGTDKPHLFFSKKALEIKKMEPLKDEFVREAFNQEDLIIYHEAKELEQKIISHRKQQEKATVYLFMSSGNYGGINLMEVFN
ncbi:MAG: Mur ligase family protein [Flavobacteriales bacterium]|jgi:UDP-N-acetylmuramate: L-alanyl-gamma-D-glutamyl-meso-diaminopimelate ligase|nr:Mur ligase family protein [Flavobacteriales bacterium]